MTPTPPRQKRAFWPSKWYCRIPVPARPSYLGTWLETLFIGLIRDPCLRDPEIFSSLGAYCGPIAAYLASTGSVASPLEEAPRSL